jgi:outer membrane lipoprotein-sorting protein
MKTLLLTLLLCFPSVVLAQGGEALPSVDDLLKGIDQNMVFGTRTATVTMTVEGKRRTRAFTIQSFARGTDESAMLYMAPSRDKGTKMLKKGDDLWMYLPSVDRTQKISGHMLRQGMMGSDVSYEDMMQSTEMAEMYTATITGAGDVEGNACWIMELIAKDDSVTYPKRISYVGKETLIPLRQELYALSGMLLKSWTMGDIKEFEGGRKFPTRMVITDEVKKDSRTIIEFPEMTFGIELEEEVFSQRWLERK